MHWLGWVAIHHIPWVGAATAGREVLFLSTKAPKAMAQ